MGRFGVGLCQVTKLSASFYVSKADDGWLSKYITLKLKVECNLIDLFCLELNDSRLDLASFCHFCVYAYCGICRKSLSFSVVDKLLYIYQTVYRNPLKWLTSGLRERGNFVI